METVTFIILTDEVNILAIFVFVAIGVRVLIEEVKYNAVCYSTGGEVFKR